MVQLGINVIVFLVLLDAVIITTRETSSDTSDTSSGTSTGTSTSKEDGHAKPITIKKKKSRGRSTSSSSSGTRSKSEDSSGDNSLGLTSSSSSSETSREGKKRYVPVSSAERKGWRKWHRKCQRCPEDARKKWRDPSINWICGAYQRARRSFKSLCSMHYRNCQDGTMFVKIREHRCPNDTVKEQFPHGDHFFYEYKVSMSADSTESARTSDSSDEESSDYSD